MAFLKETKGTLKAFFIFVGILYLVSLNVIYIIFGLLYIYFGIALDKLLPAKQKMISGTIWTVLVLNAFLNALKFFFSDGITVGDIASFAVVLLFSVYLIRSVKRISSEQNMPQNETVIQDNKNDHTVRNMAILVVVLAVIGFIMVTFLNKL